MIIFYIFVGCMLALAFCYAIILVSALIGITRVPENRPARLFPPPMISVVIPVRNEAESIGTCLISMADQDFPRDRFEVVISDDFSDDETIPIAKKIIANYPDVKWVIVTGDEQDMVGQGKKAAIERAISVVRGALVLTTDADTWRERGWLLAFSDFFRETGARMILGPVFLRAGKTVLGKFQSLEFLGIMGITMGFANNRVPVMCNGANLCYAKKAFKRVEGFKGNRHMASGDDQFLLEKITQQYGGKEIRFLTNRAAIVETVAVQDWGSFFSQRFRWVSKSRGYRGGLVMAVGAVTYLFQVLIVVGAVVGTGCFPVLELSLGLLGFKMLVDFPVVVFMARFFNTRKLLAWYFPAQVFQVLYTTLMVPLAFLAPVKWKGRRV